MKDNLIKSIFFSTVFYSIAYPNIQKCLMDAINSKLIAINNIIICISTILIGNLWNKYKDKLFNYYLYFLISEALLYIIVMSIVIINNHLICYYILDTLIFSTISRNILIGGNTLKAIKYKDKNNRNKYDNNVQIYSSIATLLGSSICLLTNLSLTVSFIFMFLGITLDNVFYGIEYLKIKSKERR